LSVRRPPIPTIVSHPVDRPLTADPHPADPTKTAAFHPADPRPVAPTKTAALAPTADTQLDAPTLSVRFSPSITLNQTNLV
jgi:hypothetical protein